MFFFSPYLFLYKQCFIDYGISGDEWDTQKGKYGICILKVKQYGITTSTVLKIYVIKNYDGVLQRMTSGFALSCRKIRNRISEFLFVFIVPPRAA